ncbi:MAG TPA: Gfo/Idh/MocA family oxidoreductase, partial [Vicinamibacteria bacterium]|nr:Gfo/Idh/MocA family oxidoreductase [Vicinamibacteria bacterium]
MDRPFRVLVAGCGNMGASHARAYHRMPEFQVVGVVSRGPASRRALSTELGGVPEFGDY